MKQLTSEKLGNYDVEVQAEHRADGSILLVATCGGTKREHSISINPNHEYTDEQFQKDIDAARLAVAKEAAGHEHTRLLREKFFAPL